MITTACVACGKNHRVKPEMLGKKARCTCGSPFAITAVAVKELPPTPSSPQPASRLDRPVAQPATAVRQPPATCPPISRQVREWAWVLSGIGWLLMAMCCILAIGSAGMAFDGTLAKSDWDQRSAIITGMVALNLVAAGLLFIGKSHRLASLFPNAATGPTLPGTLGNRFRLFGDLTGRTRAEITAAVGRPISISHMASGTLVLWGESGYRLAAMFDGGDEASKCQRITSEISV